MKNINGARPNASKVAVAAVAFVILLVISALAFYPSDGGASRFSVASPVSGFVWDYGENLRINHIGNGTVPDFHGRPQEVEILQLESRTYFANHDTWVERDRYYLVTPDFRYLVFSYECTIQAGACEEKHRIQWHAPETPWLSGASQWFGSEVVIQDSSALVRWPGHDDFQSIEENMSFEGNALLVEGIEGASSWDPNFEGFYLGMQGSYRFEQGIAPPQWIQAPELFLGDQDSIELSGTTEFSGVPIHKIARELSPLPLPQPEPNLIPVHSPDWDHPFPFSEAWNQIEDQVSSDAIVTLLRGGDPMPASFGFSFDLVGHFSVEESYQWRIGVDPPDGEPTEYTVTKVEDRLGRFEYRVESDELFWASVEEVQVPRQVIPFDEVTEFVKRETGYGYTGFGTFPYVEEGTLTRQFLSIYLNVSDARATGVTVNPPLIRFNYHDGNLMGGFLPTEEEVERFLWQ